VAEQVVDSDSVIAGESGAGVVALVAKVDDAGADGPGLGHATDDIATEVGRLRDQPGEGVVSIGGAGLAAAAFAEDLIDEYRQFVNPVILGGGTPYFTPLAKPLDLRLVSECRETDIFHRRPSSAHGLSVVL
jgi:dihydrofolate reductase